MKLRTIPVAGDPFHARGARLIAALVAAQECERCGVSVVVPDEGTITDDGVVLCHGCSENL